MVLEDNTGQKYCCGHFGKNHLPPKTKWNSLVCANHSWLLLFYELLSVGCMYFCSQRVFMEIGRRQTTSVVIVVF